MDIAIAVGWIASFAVVPGTIAVEAPRAMGVFLNLPAATGQKQQIFILGLHHEGVEANL